ncbi:hypothetical protein Tco_0037131, partial [Tanacetum coccineum]
MNVGELPEIDPYEEVAQQGYVPPLSPAYVPDLMEFKEHVPVYVQEPEHSEYHAPSDDDIQEDPEEDPSEEHEPEDDDDDDDMDDEDEEPTEDEEEEHIAPANSFAVHVVDPVPLAGDTEAFETDESSPTPKSPYTRACIAEHVAALTPSLPVASSPLPLPSPLTTSPTDAGEPLGYRAAGIRMRAAAASPPLLLLSTSHRTDAPEAEMPPQKRVCFTTPTPGFEIGESSVAGAARRPWPTPKADAWDEIVEAMMEIAPTTLEGVDQRVT